MASAAASAVAGATVASAVASTSEIRPRSAIVAVAAAAGGVGGFLLWRFAGSKATGVERAICLVDTFTASRGPREGHLGNSEYCLEVERWTVQLAGGPDLVSPALRLAARGAALEDTEAKCAARLEAICRKAGVDEAIVSRATRLASRDLPAADRELHVLEDALVLVSLSSELEEMLAKAKEDAQLIDILQKTWRKMSREAQTIAVSFEYSPRVLGCLVEAITAAEGFQVNTSPMVAPRLPSATVALLRKSWAQVPKDKFGNEFFERLYSEDMTLAAVFDYAVVRPSNISKAVEMMLDLLDLEQVPRLERIVHGVAALSRHFGRLRMSHMAAIKRALVRSVVAHANKEKKKTNQAWEALVYAIYAVAGPHLVINDTLHEFSAATAAALPTPGGGPHAGAIAAHGAALLEMSLSITALSQGGTAAPEEVQAKLYEARGWLVDSVRNDVNAYCGLLSSAYARGVGDTEAEGESAARGADEAERKRWLRRAIEVPLRVAEVSMGAAVACLPCRRQIKRSLQGDWIAGAKLLRTATEISMKNVTINVRELDAQTKAANDIDRRMMQLRDTEPPWEDLCDL